MGLTGRGNMSATRTAPLDIQRMQNNLHSTWEMEGRTGWSTSSRYPDNVQSRMECWQDIVLELERRLGWFEHEAAEKIALAKEPLKRELRRVADEMQELIKWNEAVERQRDAAKAQLPPLEEEVERLQVCLSDEASNHLATRDDLRVLKERYHADIQQWKEQLEKERQARNAALKQHETEIADLQARRIRAEELMEDQKKSLEWKEEVITKYKRDLTASEIASDKHQHHADSLQRQLTHLQDERERDKELAQVKLDTTVKMLNEQHQLAVDSLNEARARMEARHKNELAEKDAQLEDERLQHSAELQALRAELEADKAQAVEAEQARTAVVESALEACRQRLAEEKRALAQSRQAHADEVAQLKARLAKIDKSWEFKLAEVKRELDAMTLRYNKSEHHGSGLRQKIADIESDHWEYQSIDKTAGPHIRRPYGRF